MARRDDSSDLTGTEARGAVTPGVTRYVLGISLVLIVVLFGIVLFIWG